MDNQTDQVDILAIGAHPDDVEIGASGTLLKHIDAGKSVAIVDLTQGELGTRGSGPLRLREGEEARKKMGAKLRVNLGLADGLFDLEEGQLRKLVIQIRRFQPDIILANAISDRHPDHGRGAEFVRRATFLSGLVKIETEYNGLKQERWRPRAIYHYMQAHQLKPDVLVDITPYIEKKIELIQCFSSQFYDPDSTEPESHLTDKDFFDVIRAKAKVYGRPIRVPYAEGFNVARTMGIDYLTDLI